MNAWSEFEEEAEKRAEKERCDEFRLLPVPLKIGIMIRMLLEKITILENKIEAPKESDINFKGRSLSSHEARELALDILNEAEELLKSSIEKEGRRCSGF